MLGERGANNMVRTIFPYLSRAIGIIAMLSFSVALASLVEAAPVPFTYVAIPDIQDETDSHPDMLQSDVNWLLSNQSSQNIAYVGQLGDITNASGAAEFQTAHNILFQLNGASGLAFGTCPGDHDSVPQANGAMTNYLTSFGPTNFAGQSWYGGSNMNSDGTAGASSYQTFQEGGRSFLVLNLEYHAVSPSSAELLWAQGVLNAHPGVPTILQTHQYLNNNGTLLPGEGTGMWNGLVKNNSQIFMVTSGHVDGTTVDSGEAFTTATDAAGLPVFELLSNFQSINSGDGLMRLYQFDEANSAIHVKTYSPYDTTTPYQTDAASQFDIAMNFNSRLGTAVPEPSTLILAAGGALALFAYRWLRCRKAS
jgi:hypothetical protein